MQEPFSNSAPQAKGDMVWRWVAVIGLVGLAAWCANLAAFNFWAAGGPPTPHPDYYRHWGNVYFAATCGLLTLAVAFAVMNLRRMKKGHAPRSQ